jgi:guanylate kinase
MKRLTTLTGPSCAGKTTLEARLEKMGALRAVSTTTRAPRPGEVDGVDYYFVSLDKFLALKQCEMFVESAKFGEHYYGLCTAELKRLHMQGDHVVVVCEPQGAKNIRKYCAENSHISLCQVFVDSSQPVIIDRFLRRFLQEIDSARNLGTKLAVTRAFEAQSKRLLIMSGVERGWIEEAYGAARPDADDAPAGHFRYDRLIEQFDDTNIDEIATSLMLLKVPELT